VARGVPADTLRELAGDDSAGAIRTHRRGCARATGRSPLVLAARPADPQRIAGLSDTRPAPWPP